MLSVTNGDGSTSNMEGDAETSISNPDELDMLEGAEGTNNYNEILLRRYSENGMPKRPDYIVAENGQITETMLRHAEYFGIPIINIDKDAYAQKTIERGGRILDSLSETDSYEEINDKLADLKSISFYKQYYKDIERFGHGQDALPEENPGSLEARCLEVAKLELEKRIEFIADKLRNCVAEMRAATARGERASECPQGLKTFEVLFKDIPNDRRMSTVTGYGATQEQYPGSCSQIKIKMELEGSSRTINTSITDGEHPYDADSALRTHRLRQEDLDNADSSYFNQLSPLVEEYFAALRENREIA